TTERVKKENQTPKNQRLPGCFERLINKTRLYLCAFSPSFALRFMPCLFRAVDMGSGQRCAGVAVWWSVCVCVWCCVGCWCVLWFVCVHACVWPLSSVHVYVCVVLVVHVS